MDGRSRELGHDYIYGSTGGTLVAYDDPPEQAAPSEARRAKTIRRAEASLTKLLRDHARKVKRAFR